MNLKFEKKTLLKRYAIIRLFPLCLKTNNTVKMIKKIWNSEGA